MALFLLPTHPSLMVPEGSSILFVSSSSLKVNVGGVGVCVCVCVCVCLNVRSTNITNYKRTYEGWNFNSGNYLFTTDTK